MLNNSKVKTCQNSHLLVPVSKSGSFATGRRNPHGTLSHPTDSDPQRADLPKATQKLVTNFRGNDEAIGQVLLFSFQKKGGRNAPQFPTIHPTIIPIHPAFGIAGNQRHVAWSTEEGVENFLWNALPQRNTHHHQCINASIYQCILKSVHVYIDIYQSIYIYIYIFIFIFIYVYNLYSRLSRNNPVVSLRWDSVRSVK